MIGFAKNPHYEGGMSTQPGEIPPSLISSVDAPTMCE